MKIIGKKLTAKEWGIISGFPLDSEWYTEDRKRFQIIGTYDPISKILPIQYELSTKPEIIEVESFETLIRPITVSVFDDKNKALKDTKPNEVVLIDRRIYYLQKEDDETWWGVRGDGSGIVDEIGVISDYDGFILNKEYLEIHF